MVLRTMADSKPANVTFRKAVLCPDLGVNLISTDIVDRLGGKITNYGGKATVEGSGQTVHAHRNRGLLHLQLQSVPSY
jgi:hypothetical protein